MTSQPQSHAAAAVPPSESGAFHVRMLELRAKFVERTQRDAAIIRSLRERWHRGGPLSSEHLSELTRTVHGLSGAAGVFGFDTISNAAHRAEMSLRRLDGSAEDPAAMLDVLEAELAAFAPSIG